MKIPFYQTVWNNINLLELAKELNHPYNILPTANFYEAYYKKLDNKSFLASEWRAEKAKQSEWLHEQIDLYSHKNHNILSIGAGTGIVELPLITKGYHIHLFECQEESLKFYGVDKLTTCYYGSLDSIASQKYDLAICVAVTYALTDKEWTSFLKSCERILKQNGVLIILDTSLSWREIYCYIRNRQYYARNYLLWGFKRTVDSCQKMAKDFSLLRSEYYNEAMKVLNVKKILNIPYNTTPVWQMMVFKKND